MLTLPLADLADERLVDEAWLKRWGWYECQNATRVVHRVARNVCRAAHG